MQMQSISQRTWIEKEAIAWHLREVIGGDDSRYHRVVFNEITKMPFKKHLNSQHVST